MMRSRRTAILGLVAAIAVPALIGLSLQGCASSGALPDAGPLTSIEELDLDRYLGTWYEIARYPHRFERGLVGVTATYSRNDDGTIRVLNAGREDTLDGERDEAVGKAWIPDPAHPARLKVRFFWPFTGSYWVIALDPDYRWAIVGEPGRRYLWILSRTPALPDATIADLLARIRAHGYDPTPLEFVEQRPA